MTAKKARYNTKENRIPLGKKKENLEKNGVLIKNQELKTIVDPAPKKKASKTNKKNELKSLKVINLNVAPTDTSLTKPIKKPQTKLSIINELEEKPSNVIVRSKKVTTVLTNIPSSNHLNLQAEKGSIVNLQCENDVDNFNNTMDQSQILPTPEVVLSPFVCTTRGQKWKPSPVKPPKLSELYVKYEVDNVADTYRKKLDEATDKLHVKVTYWTKLLSENGCNIPESVKDEIDVVCGQTKLLTTDKFMQMRSLIELHENNSGTMPIKSDDLDGYWDMLLLQVRKLEGQFNELEILKGNEWIPIQAIAKKIINRVPKVKRPLGSSTFSAFLKSKKENPNNKKHHNSATKDDTNHSKFYEMKLSNNTCLTSSTPASSNPKPVSFSPILLKTMELSYVARRSGMTPLILGEDHVSPLKSALKNTVSDKATKRKNIHFKTPETSTEVFVTPENSYDHCVTHKKSVQNRVVTPHATKVPALNQNDLVANTQDNSASKINDAGAIKIIGKANSKEKKTSKLVKPAAVKNHNSSLRRSDRLACKLTKNYKC